MYQYLKNIFINKVYIIQNIVIFSFSILIILNIFFYKDNLILQKSNLLNWADIIFSVEFFIKFIYLYYKELLLILFLLIISVCNRLLDNIDIQLISIYSLFIILGNFIQIKINYINNALLLYVIVAFLLTIKLIFQSSIQYISKNIIIQSLIALNQKILIDKYIITLIRIILLIFCTMIFLLNVYIINKLNTNLIYYFLFFILIMSLLDINYLLIKDTEKILNNELCIFTTKDYKNYLNSNKFLINKNFLLIISFIFIICFTIEFNLLAQYLYILLCLNIAFFLMKYLNFLNYKYKKIWNIIDYTSFLVTLNILAILSDKL